MNKIFVSECGNSDGQKKFSTRFPNQYPIYETPGEILSIDEYKYCAVVFDDMLENEQKDLLPFFTRGRLEEIEVFYLSQHLFELPLLIREKSNINIF